MESKTKNDYAGECQQQFTPLNWSKSVKIKLEVRVGG
jgi:hypothetical protein